MAIAVGKVSHEDHLSLVDHLDELRTRLIISLAAVAIAFGFCLWQNHSLLHIINQPLERQTQKQVKAGHGPLGQTALAQQGVLKVAGTTEGVLEILGAPSSGLSASTRAALRDQSKSLRLDVAKIPKKPEGNKPVTLGIGEPFSTTIGIALIFALILALPVVLYELYGFLLPALEPSQQRAVRPLVLAIPALFAVGVCFGYFVVLPAAVRFFQNFNSNEFNVLVQANPYYHFAAVILLAMGLIFQIPVGILAITRAGILTPGQLRKNRRYAILACGAVAAFLPGDAITLILETVPLYLLFELSLILATLSEWRARRRQATKPPALP